MDSIKELIFSGNLIGWIILVVLLILFIKILKSAGKGLLLFAAFCACVFLIAKFFPGIAEPIADFIRGGWLGEHRPDKPW
ncbi:hypothetical protein DDZ13_13745 [Coraliomargarita sinensis]|uniref:Uncharacterized protein n=1 Tax=Coraliomargarita sinensis TaxID=2174842 RepID=A0A317ZD77_9BACT|nr:hypothetical protein [Coraliomargarita sinensis]PXA03126.1 hypothetical protein DDZ13_13745 [Coraliomargarita sinensis]